MAWGSRRRSLWRLTGDTALNWCCRGGWLRRLASHWTRRGGCLPRRLPTLLPLIRRLDRASNGLGLRLRLYWLLWLTDGWASCRNLRLRSRCLLLMRSRIANNSLLRLRLALGMLRGRSLDLRGTL